MKKSCIYSITAEQLGQKLSKFNLDKLAQQSGLVKRAGRKLTAQHMVIGFYLSTLASRALFSFSHWALQISLLLGRSVSKQAIAQRVNQGQHKFAELLMNQSLGYQLTKGTLLPSKHSLFSHFNRVLLQDSTVLKVSDGLSAIFKGCKSKTGNSASIRLQHIYELKSEQSLYFAQSGFTTNDQSVSGDIINLLQAGDVLIRDLGYFALPVFEQIQQQQAFYLSRLQYKTNLYEGDSDHQIELLKYLDKQTTIDMYCQVGSKQRLKARIVAIKLPDAIAGERRRKLEKKNSRDRRVHYTQLYRQLLGWVILMTNVEAQTWSAEQLLQAYGFRWRMESIFKCWKSHFHLPDLSAKGKMSEEMVRIFIYYLLCFITLFWICSYQYWFEKVYQTAGRYLSIFKFTDVVMTCAQASLFATDDPFLLEILCKFATYDQHNKRVNYMQALLEDNSVTNYIILCP